MLEELETCKALSSDSLEPFLVNAVVISEFVAREKQTTLVNPQKLAIIVNNNLRKIVRILLSVLMSARTLKKIGKQIMETRFFLNSVLGARNLSPCTEQSDFLAKPHPSKQVVAQPIK